MPIRDIEAAIAELGKYEHGDRDDDAERKRQQNFKRKWTGHPARGRNKWLVVT